MREWLIARNLKIVWLAAALSAVACASGEQAPGAGAGQEQAYKAPRMVGTDKPDLNGIWQTLTTANWDLLDHSASAGPAPRAMGIWGAQPPGRGIVEGGEIPYTPEALAKKQENFKRRLEVDHDNLNTVGDPEAKCYMPGVPRAAYLPYPFQILQSTDRIIMAYAFANASRTIPLDKATEPPVDFWMGWSNGSWDGDTLVVDVTGFNDMTWFDRAGNHHSEQLHVVERYAPMTPYHLQYEATIEDPQVFTRPWKISLPLYRRMEKDVQLLEFKCVDLSEEFVYGGLLRKPTN
jgi:hypothetical protein